jgi:hypothetical protein
MITHFTGPFNQDGKERDTMSQQGRFGKYGDLKRKQKIRLNRLMQQGLARRIVSSAGQTQTVGRRDQGVKKK